MELIYIQCGAPYSYKLVCKPHEYYVYLDTINHSENAVSLAPTERDFVDGSPTTCRFLVQA